MGVDAVWRLELPKAANPFDFRSIADVLFTIEYTALDSPEYRQTVIRTLGNEVTGDRSFSVRDDFPDVWFALNNPDTAQDPADRMRITLPLTDDDFPRNLDSPTVTQLTLFVVRAGGLDAEVDINTVRHELPGSVTEVGKVRTVDGVVGTRRPGGAPWRNLTGAGPTGTWVLQLDDIPLVRSWFTNGLIEDLVLVFTLSAVTPNWP